MRLLKFIFVLTIGLIFFCTLTSVMDSAAHATEPVELLIRKNWRGDYPVSALSRLPEAMRSSSVGYIENPKRFAAIWEVFKTGEKIPDVDFKTECVIFARNTDFYSRMGIAKVFLTDGVSDIVIMQTLSALPIEDKVGMALAVIPKAGMMAINNGQELIPVGEVTPYSWPLGNGAVANDTMPAYQDSSPPTADTLNVTCMIEGRVIPLKEGRSEVISTMDSAVKIRTYVSGNLVFGDLDDDGDEDAVFVLVQDSGGSGTFYYVAAAVNANGIYSGSNAVLLGDRIEQKSLQIRNGLVVAEYFKRKTGEPMSSPPEKVSQVYMVYESGNLEDVTVRDEGEQLLEGWVRIGHEVRSFQPCYQNTEYWIDGDSPALKAVVLKYLETLPGANSYTPLFMIIKGKVVQPPVEGFGAEYERAFFAVRLIRISKNGSCLIAE